MSKTHNEEKEGGGINDTPSAGSFIELVQSLSRLELAGWTLIIGVILGAVLVSVSKLISHVLLGNVQQASHWAAVISGFATTALVLVTMFYASYTRKLVGVMEQSRKEEREHREERRKRDLDKLRRSLLQEITAVEDLDEFAESFEPGQSAYLKGLIPNEVYKSNASNIGLLSESEIDSVIEYYSLADMLNNHFEIHLDRDTTIGMGYIEETLRLFSLDWWVQRSKREDRTQSTRDQIRRLSEAQDEAISSLQANLSEDTE